MRWHNDLKVYYLVYLLKQMPNTDFNQYPELIEKFLGRKGFRLTAAKLKN
jgi:hypothetical protein